MSGRGEYFDTDAPWICWRFLSTDRRTRITGRSVVLMDCCVCGGTRKLRIKIPRFGDTTTNGKHPARARFILDHLHPERGHPMSWAKPLRNPFAQPGGLDLDLLAMRLKADIAAGVETGPGKEQAEQEAEQCGDAAGGVRVEDSAPSGDSDDVRLCPDCYSAHGPNDPCRDLGGL